jgi:exopolysaccharide production protein ExoQ
LLAPVAYAVTIALLARRPASFLRALRHGAPVLFLVALPFLSVLWSEGGSATLRRAVALVFSLAFAYHLAIAFTPRQLLRLTLAVLIPCLAASLLLAAAPGGHGWMPPLSGAPGLRGVFLHKNVLGWYAAVAAIASVGYLLEARGRERALAYACIALSGVCLLGSQSTTGLLCTAAALGLFAFYGALGRCRRQSRAMLVLLFVQFCALLLGLLGEFIGPMLEAIGEDATLTGRVPLWALVDEAIAERPLLGFGYKAFWEASPEAFRIWATVGWNAPHAHNGYRDMLLSFGVLGTAVMLATVARALVAGAALHCRTPQAGWLWLNVLIGAFLVMNLVESMFLKQNDTLFILFGAAMLMCLLHRRRPTPGLSRARMSDAGAASPEGSA